ncbi:MAG: hypothetical protein LAT61_07345 [Alcanivorax sp.]|nr:hypothetical protein [Alcanivorax sp.]
MFSIIFGSLLLSWATLMAAYASLALVPRADPSPSADLPSANKDTAPDMLRRLALPAAVWLTWVLLLVLLIPGTALLETGHGMALGGSLFVITLVCAAGPARLALARYRRR